MTIAHPDSIAARRGGLARETEARAASARPLRVFYAIGPGDAVAFHRDLALGRAPDFQMSMAFSAQFLEWCDGAGAVARVVSSAPRQDTFQAGAHQVENRPKKRIGSGRGWTFHLGQFWYGLRVVRWAAAARADVAVVDSGTCEWIALALLRLFGIPVIAVLHNTLWPMGNPPRRAGERVLRLLDSIFFRRIAAATVGVSPECARQVREIAGAPRGPVLQCRAQFRADFLSRVPPVAEPRRAPFRVLFLGRIETIKGIWLIVDLARHLEAEHPGAFQWRMAGHGAEFEPLTKNIAAAGLGNLIRVDGRLPGTEAAIETLGWCHAMIVPTMPDFCEGLAMTAAESVLAGRPVVVSSVVPAWEVLGGAALKAEAGNVTSFAAAMKRLAFEPGCYEECRRATADAQGQFYDRSRGLGSVVGRAVMGVVGR